MKKATVAAIMILITASPLFKGLYFNYEAYGFLALLALLSIFYFLYKIRQNEPLQVNKLFVLAGVLLVAAVTISFTNALNPRENLGALLLYSELLIVFMILYDYYGEKKQNFIRTIMLLVVATGSICSFAGLMSLTGKFNILGALTTERIGSTFQYSNTASIYFAICCIFATTLAMTLDNIILRSVMAGLGSIFLLSFFLTGSRGGLIVGTALILVLIAIQPSGWKLRASAAFAIMLAPMLLIVKRFNTSAAAHDNIGTAKWIGVTFVIPCLVYFIAILAWKFIMKEKQVKMPKGSSLIFWIAAGVIAVLAVIFRNSLLPLLPPILSQRLARLSFNDVNVLYRLHFDMDALKLLADHWLAGLGGGGWKALYQSVQDYYYTAVFVHNNYLQVFVEHGILGVASYILLVILAVIGALLSLLKARGNVLRSYTAGLFCGFIALAAHAAIDFDLSFVSLSLLFWVMFAASAVGLPKVAGEDGSIEIKPIFFDKLKIPLNNKTIKFIIIIAGSALFTFYAMYLTAAYNENKAHGFASKGDYKTAAVYYEEAYRFDSENTEITFELSKLYHFFAMTSKSEEDKKAWFDKALAAAKKSMDGNRYYPSYINTMVHICLDSGRPVEALEHSQQLVTYQRYNSKVYELLARSYIASARYYEERGERDKAKEMLTECIKIDKNPDLPRTAIKWANEVNSVERISGYKHSKELSRYLLEAEERLKIFQ